MTTQTVRERLAAPFTPDVRVNRLAGHIDNVLICGIDSRNNNRHYPAAVLRRDFAKYEGVVVNCDHKDAPGAADRLGWFSDVRPGSDGRPRGRLNILKAHPLAARVFEAAERRPQLFGMSHVAVCSTSRKSGRETVESINKVLSIDLVADPATTTGLYESVTRRVLAEIADATDTLPPRSDAGVAVLLDRVRKLADEFETGTITIDAFDEQVKELVAAYRKVAKHMPAAEGRVPSDGKAFAEWVRGGSSKTFAEFTAPAERGGVPTDGKAFAERVGAASPTLPPAEYARFIASIKGY